jgi:[acyl-carrier-protein] S-malonyltransferase
MGRELYDDARGRAVFDEVDAAIGEKLSSVIFNGPAEDLDRPEIVQPAIFAVSMAMLAARDGAAADFVVGHSLGEYSALCAAGCFSIADGAKLLRRRGELMASAVPAGLGAMAAIIGAVDIAAVCGEASAKAGGICEPANFNSPGQVVISGNSDAIDAAVEIAKAAGAKIAKRLAVSVPAHCSLMAPAADGFRAVLDAVPFAAPKIPFVSNKTAEVMSDAAEIKDALVYQLTHGVRWTDCVLTLKRLGADDFVEVGPGAVLTGLVKRII